MQDRLNAWAGEVRGQAERLPPGAERDALLKKARQADVASHMDDWANVLLGVGLMISPWVWGYSGHDNALLNALFMGLLVTLTSGWALERVLYDKFKVWRAHHHAH